MRRVGLLKRKISRVGNIPDRCGGDAKVVGRCAYSALCVIAFSILLIMKPTVVTADPAVRGVNQREIQSNILADNIFVCSDFDDVNADRIGTFYKSAFPGWKIPDISDGFREFENLAIKNVLLIATSDHLPETVKECLSEFPLIKVELMTRVIEHTQKIGKKLGALEGLDLPDYYDPIKAGWLYIRKDNWLIMSFASVESEPYRTNHAITKLFGLDISICDRVVGCGSD